MAVGGARGCLAFFVFCLESELVYLGRVRRVLHELRAREEGGELWFKKGCEWIRIATAVNAKKGNALCMYCGGSALLAEFLQLCDEMRVRSCLVFGETVFIDLEGMRR